MCDLSSGTRIWIRNRELELHTAMACIFLSSQKKKTASQTRQRQPPTISWCRVFHLQDWRWDNSSFHKGKGKPETEANLLKMCRVADTAPAETRTFVQPLPGSQEVIAEGQLVTLIPLSPTPPTPAYPPGRERWRRNGVLRGCWETRRFWSRPADGSANGRTGGPDDKGPILMSLFSHCRVFLSSSDLLEQPFPAWEKAATQPPKPTQPALHLPQEPNGILMNAPTTEALHSARQEEKKKQKKHWECFPW